MSYEDAVQLLNTRRAKPAESLTEMRGTDDMGRWIELMGHSMQELDRLRIIHVAGTNGKGSTCQLTAALLHAHGRRTGWPKKVGVYTSPHLVCLRERILVNGEQISEQAFAKAFFQVWERLPLKPTPDLDIPRYLQLLTLLAYHYFLEQKVDVMVCEVHLGGEFDATNVITSPCLTAITPIGMDHAHLLGPTIEDIAWHKAGIMKHSRPTFSTEQCRAVTDVLYARALEKDVHLELVSSQSGYEDSVTAAWSSGQKQNFSLSLKLADAWLQSYNSRLDPDAIPDVTKSFRSLGKFMHVGDRWFVDGAHNSEALQSTAEWFATARDSSKLNVLMFAHFSKRDSGSLLEDLLKALEDFHVSVDCLLLTSYQETDGGVARLDRNGIGLYDENKQQRNARVWRDRYPDRCLCVERSIESAIAVAQRRDFLSQPWQVLVTGSLKLAGGFLNVYHSQSNEATRI